MMHLLSVEEVFQITGRGVVVLPHLPPPAGRTFRPFRRFVAVERPNGVKTDEEALFAIEHFTLVGGGGKLVTVVAFPRLCKQDVPVGSHILVDAETLAALPGTE